MNNRCAICGEPCRVKYCKDCAPKAYRQTDKFNKMGKVRQKYRGCDEDCFNCPYDDCLKPEGKLKTDIDTKALLFGGGKRADSAMYTLNVPGVRSSIVKRLL